MIRTRFAPSPTGYLHVGGLRTALYCYLFAKKNNGKFILRIEDTDQERFVEGALENLIKTLNWIGITYDEGPIDKNGKIIQTGEKGPYIQSQRTDLYKKHVQELIEKKHAYYCFCTKERLDTLRESQEKAKLPSMYDRKCLNMAESEIQEKLKNGEKYVIRQKMPFGALKFKDLIRGNVQFDGKLIDDQVLIKSDGFPTYHLANVVDDHLMEITHVIRGEEWLPSTPKHIALYNSFGWNIPQFAHLPLLLNADKTKLSKRQGHVSVEEYINEGYLKEAIINFAAFLGWNAGSGEEKEIYTLKELEDAFSIEKVHKAGAVFNIEKLDWFNWKWRKANYEKSLKDPTDKQEKKEALYKIVESYINEEYKKDADKLKDLLPSVEEKILKNPKEINENISFYFKLPEYEKSLLTNEKMQIDVEMAKSSLQHAKELLSKLEKWDEESIKEALIKEVERLKIKNGQMLWPIRAALTGLPFSPGAFEVAAALGKEEVIRRITNAL
jgi:glutamyl-tRNA synthetase